LSGIKNNNRRKYDDCHNILNGVLYKLCANIDCSIGWQPCSKEYFYHNTSNKTDGYNPLCILCAKNKNKLYQRSKQQEYSIYWQSYYLDKKVEYNDKRRLKRMNNEEMDVVERRKRESEWRKQNPEKVRTNNKKKYNKKHRISQSDWHRCKEYFDNCCAYCGLHISNHYCKYNGIDQLRDFHKDHVDNNGYGDISNCVCSCRKCNVRKWKFSLGDWYQPNNPDYKQERYDKIIKWVAEDYNTQGT